MEKHLEHIITNKNYGELTDKEKFALQEIASDEESFKEMKSLLLQLNQDGPLITPKESSKTALMKEFNKVYSNAPVIAESKDKKVIGIWWKFTAAACIIGLLFTFLFQMNGSVTENSVAQSEDVISEENVIEDNLKKEELNLSQEEKNSGQNDLYAKESFLNEKDKGTPSIKRTNKQQASSIIANQGDSYTYPQENSNDNSTPISSKGNNSVTPTMPGESSQDDFALDTISNSEEFEEVEKDQHYAKLDQYLFDSNQEITTISSNEIALSDEIVEEDTEIAMNEAPSIEMTAEKKEISTIREVASKHILAKSKDEGKLSHESFVKSKSLAENADLIKHFHTAM